MAIQLQIKRGLKKDLPALAAGEFGLCEDTGELFVGSAGGNLPVRLPEGAGDMLQKVYDTNADGTVDRADEAARLAANGCPLTPYVDKANQYAYFGYQDPAYNGGKLSSMEYWRAKTAGDADTVDGKHASEFATSAQGQKADGALPAKGGDLSGSLRIIDGYLFLGGVKAADNKGLQWQMADGTKYILRPLDSTGLMEFVVLEPGDIYHAPITITKTGICSISGSAASTRVLNAGNENYDDGTHQVRVGWFGNPSGRGPALCFQVDGPNGASNVSVDISNFAMRADADGNGNHIPSTYLPRTGGAANGYIQFGTSNTGLEWYTASGTRYHVRPWSPNNVFQITRLKSGGSEQGVLNIYDTSAEFVGNASTASSAASNTFYVGNSSIYSSGAQYMEMRPGGEANYKLVYGVYDGYWCFTTTGNAQSRLGSANHKWHDVWSISGVIQTSDRNAKNSIAELDETALELLRRLKPSRYHMNDGTAGRTHYGFIAQDVEAAMEQLGLTSLDFAGLCKDQRQELYQIITEEPLLNDADGDFLGFKNELKEEWRPVFDDDGQPVYNYSLRYDEIVPLAVLGAQEALRRAESLETECRALHEENKALQDALAALTAQQAEMEKRLAALETV